MTELLERAFTRVSALSLEAQDECARVLMSLADEAADGTVLRLTPEEEASLARSLEQAERREFATDGEVQAIWAKYGL